MALDPATFDLATLASLASAAANARLLDELHGAGFEGIRTSHGYVIQLLVDEEPTVGELADRLGVSQQAASKSVVELEGLGIVERRTDPRDSRARRVALTPRGRELLETTRVLREALEQQLPGDLRPAKAALVALLTESGGLEAVAARRARPAPE
jgi:DNA-binding MarR family transcriptional regulator